MRIGAIIMGILFIVLGGWIFTVMRGEVGGFWLYIYPLISVIIGVALIAFNYSEEKKEQRKDLIKKKSN